MDFNNLPPSHMQWYSVNPEFARSNFFFVPYETSNIGCDGKRHSAFGSPKVFEPNEMSAAVLLPQHLH